MAKCNFFAFFLDFLFVFQYFFVPLRRSLCTCVYVREYVRVNDDEANRKNNHLKIKKI